MANRFENKKVKRRARKNILKPYEPTEAEAEAVADLKAAPPVPCVKFPGDKSGVAELQFPHKDKAVGEALLLAAFGATDKSFVEGLVRQVINVATQGRKPSDKGNDEAIDFTLSVITGIKPRDQVEAMLALQMAAVHNATATFARRLAHVENIAQQDSAERAFNKLCRTFAAQVEALKRYRSVGEQTVRVEHVTVNEGGQAIVGNVSHGGRGASQKTEATP